MRTIFFLLLIMLSEKGFSQDTAKVKYPVANDTVSMTSSVEEQAEFPGGIQELYKYIKKNLKYPKTNSDFQGKVFVSFTIEPDGSISDVAVMKGIPGVPEADKEALRLIRAMPKWVPAKRNGAPVRMKFVVPVKFG
jgi:protein TonB